MYSLLVFPDGSLTEEIDWMRVGKEYRDYVGALTDAGVLRAGYQLTSPETEVAIAVRDGEVTVSPSSDAGRGRRLGGVFVLECDGLDEAAEWAARCPGAKHGEVVVRAVASNSSPLS